MRATARAASRRRGPVPSRTDLCFLYRTTSLARCIVSDDGRFIVEAIVTVDAASVDSRHPFARITSRVLRWVMEWGPRLLGVGLLILAVTARSPRPASLSPRRTCGG